MKRAKDAPADAGKKKKHKKHKKHKKASKSDKHDKAPSDGKGNAKKHKRKHKSPRRNSDSAASHSDAVHMPGADSAILSSAAATAAPSTNLGNATLSSKFTEIMKSNGHNTAPLIIKKPAVATAATANVAHISTDPSELVKQMARALKQPHAVAVASLPAEPHIPRMEIMSSDPESEEDDGAAIIDVNSPEVAVIEDEELNLEDLMKQKALLQARLGNILSESEDMEETTVSDVRHKPFVAIGSAAGGAGNRPPPRNISDVILLDDSSGEVIARRMPSKKPAAASSAATATAGPVSRPREERSVAGRETTATTSTNAFGRRGDDGGRSDLRHSNVRAPDDRDRGKASRRPDGQHSSRGNGSGGAAVDRDNRHKEDLRLEIDRDQRNDRNVGGQRDGRDGRRKEMGARGSGGGFDGRNTGNRYLMERDGGRRMGGAGDRDRYDGRGRSRDRHNRHADERGGGRRKDDKKDKFVGSLSEGQMPDRDSSSGSERGGGRGARTTKTAASVHNVDDNDDEEDEDDEEKIIEMRRRKREELLRKLAVTTSVVTPTAAELKTPDASAKKRKLELANDTDEVVFVKTKPLESNGRKVHKPSTTEPIEKEVTRAKASPETPPRSVPSVRLVDQMAESMSPVAEPADGMTESGDKPNKDGVALATANAGTATKKNDWDMFAEQDCDSNFDVSVFRRFMVIAGFHLYVCTYVCVIGGTEPQHGHR